MTDATDAPGASVPLVRDLSETALLARVFPLLPAGSATLLGPGDDAAVVAAPDGRFVVTTDVLVEDRHFRRRWSSGYDVGARAAVQNLADVAAMGAVPTSLVVSLVVPGDLPVDWVTDLARGLADACAPVGAAVVGGDLSGGDAVVVAVTAHGDLAGRDPVLRSGARPGDVVAHAGVLGRSAAGLALLEGSVGGGVGGGVGRGAAEGAGSDGAAGPGGAAERCVVGYLRPRAPLAAGPAAADAGATAMLDVSDGLLRDAGRVAAASGVVVDLEAGALAAAAADVAPAARLLGLGDDAALAWVLSGGEDHGLLATFPAGRELPAGFRRLGRVREVAAVGPRATVDGAAPSLRPGWDHFER